MKHKVTLTLFQDDATGDWGFCPKGLSDGGYGEAFNAFYNGIGIFHDVFEHWFETRHKYFNNEFSLNVGGEMAAMGAAIYYYYTLGVYNRPLSSYAPFSDAAMKTTLYMIQESAKYGYETFGASLMCAVPYQKPVRSHDLESMLEDYTISLKDTTVSESTSPEERASALRYRESISENKIRALHRWGYRMAENLVPDTCENRDTLVSFIEYWDTFCKKISAESLSHYFSEMEVIVTKVKGIIKWRAVLKSKYRPEFPDVTVSPTSPIYKLLDYIQ